MIRVSVFVFSILLLSGCHKLYVMDEVKKDEIKSDSPSHLISLISSRHTSSINIINEEQNDSFINYSLIKNIIVDDFSPVQQSVENFCAVNGGKITHDSLQGERLSVCHNGEVVKYISSIGAAKYQKHFDVFLLNIYAARFHKEITLSNWKKNFANQYKRGTVSFTTVNSNGVSFKNSIPSWVKENPQDKTWNSFQRTIPLIKKQAEYEKRVAELPLLRTVGAKVCQEYDNERIGWVRQVGFVEKVTDSSVQIRIVAARLIKAPSISPGGFKESIIWDDPLNWYICE